jgi:hypothetical protein
MIDILKKYVKIERAKRGGASSEKYRQVSHIFCENQ